MSLECTVGQENDFLKRMGLGGTFCLQFSLFCRSLAVPFCFWCLAGSGDFPLEGRLCRPFVFRRHFLLQRCFACVLA